LLGFEHIFYHLYMNSPDPDRLRYAQIAGAAARHAQGWRLTADEEARAIAELAEAAGGRADLSAKAGPPPPGISRSPNCASPPAPTRR